MNSECFGFNSMKKYNIHFLDDSHIIFSKGITYHIYNIDTKKNE